MGKFTKPQKPTEAEIERVLSGAAVADGSKAEPAATAKETRFTLVLDAEMTEAIDAARRKMGGLSRLAWIRLAIAEKLGER